MSGVIFVENNINAVPASAQQWGVQHGLILLWYFWSNTNH
jgi:hypothetical protein